MLSKILIVDYGSQLTQLIAKRIREQNIYSEIYPFDYDFSKLSLSSYKGVIFSGGPYTSINEGAPSIPPLLINLSVPILGICYGAQRLTHEWGGVVQDSKKREFGKTTIHKVNNHPILEGIPDEFVMWMSHSDHIEKPAPDFSVLAETENKIIALLSHKTKPIYLAQFHPEAYHSVHGTQFLKNFLLLTGAEKNWTMEHFLEEEIREITPLLKDKTVLLALSGGVDSLVSAVLLHKVLGKNLHCVFIDHGLLRLGEKEQVEQYIRDNFSFQFHTLDYSKEFLLALKGVSDPEQKRKIIGKLFIDSFEHFVKNNLPHIDYLAQGTIYPDIIESAGNLHAKGEVIKSHHNVGGLPENLSLSLLEPLKKLFKDEVRDLGKILGIPEKLLYRHPFPGPGLAIRIIGEVKEEYLHILKLADAIFIEELYKNDLYRKVNQAFCVFLPLRSVGVLGDTRSYDYTIALRSVQSEDFMTSVFSPLPWEFLGKVSTRITNEVLGVNRVVYDISNKPPATIEWE